MQPPNPTVTVANCTCGAKPATAYGLKDDYWTVVVMCREPERHEPYNEVYCVVTRSPQLDKAVTEAEEMWRTHRTTKPSAPSSNQLA
jgi:hypothetical protein